jgi:hypothetical protein
MHAAKGYRIARKTRTVRVRLHPTEPAVALTYAGDGRAAAIAAHARREAPRLLRTVRVTLPFVTLPPRAPGAPPVQAGGPGRALERLVAQLVRDADVRDGA